MLTPNTDQIIAEALRIYFFRNGVGNYNNPEAEELREAGLLHEARISLMRSRVQIPPPEKQIAVTNWRIINLEERNGLEWLEEWKKKDPYMLDIEGYERFLQQKQNELVVNIEVSTSTTYNGGYTLYFCIPWERIPEQHRGQEALKQQKRMSYLAGKLRKALKRAELLFDIHDIDEESVLKGLRGGSTEVFRKEDGKWYYYGDEEHASEDNIRHNAELLWKVWKTVGSLIPDCFAVGKPYWCDTIYLWARSDFDLEPFTAMTASSGYFAQEIARYSNRYKVRLVDTQEPSEPFWEEIRMFAQAILDIDAPNTYDPERDDYQWVIPEGESLPLMIAWKQTIPEVEALLKLEEIVWDPENDFSLMRSGGLELLHPYLREEKMLAWKKENIAWDTKTYFMRDVYYRRYGKEDLEAMKSDELKNICTAKSLSCPRRKFDMIEAILNHNILLETKQEPELDTPLSSSQI